MQFMMQNKRFVRKFCIAFGISIPTIIFLYKIIKNFYFKKLFGKANRKRKELSVIPSKQANTVPTFDKRFLKQFSFLLRIMFPKLFSRQVAFLITHTITLTCRTFLSIYVAHLEGILVKNIVQRSFNDFARNIPFVTSISLRTSWFITKSRLLYQVSAHFELSYDHHPEMFAPGLWCRKRLSIFQIHSSG